MSQPIDLKKIERKMTRSYYDDGLFDLQLGILLLATAVLFLVFPDWSGTTVQRMGLWFGIAMVGWVMFQSGKRYISIPRMGQVRPGTAGKARRRRTLIFMLVTFLFTVAAVVATALVGTGTLPASGLSNMGAYAMPATVAIFLVLLFGTLAVFLAYDRLFLIGLLFALPWLVAAAVEQATGSDISGLVFLIASVIIILMGVITFVRFLRENPLPADEEM